MDAVGSFIPADVLDSWYSPSPKVLSVLKEHSEWAAHTSPPARGAGLKNAIAKARGLSVQNLVLGQGSSDLIFRVLPKLVQRSGPVLLPSPVYGEYFHVLKNLYQREVVRVSTEADGFQLCVDRLIRMAREVLPSAIILVNPCNPTGKFVAREQLLRMLSALPPSTRLIIDETYIDYVRNECMESEVEKFPQLVVLKSMSKVYGLSGLRVGYAVLPRSLAHELDAFTPPYVVSTMGQLAAVAALEDEAYVAAALAETKRLRERMAKKLLAIPGLRVVEGAINSLLIDCRETLWSADEVVRRLGEGGIFLRLIDDQGVKARARYIRVAVMAEPENMKIVSALASLLSGCT